MFNESYEYLQYNSCTSRGICSINPRNSALQTVIVLYLRLLAKYSENIVFDDEVIDFVLNTISITIYNSEFNESSYIYAVENFRKFLPEIMKQFEELNPDIDMKVEKIKSEELFDNTSDIIQAIKYGERVFRRALENIPAEVRDFYNIMLVIVKDLSINLLILKSFDIRFEGGLDSILKVLSQINVEEKNIQILKKEIYDIAEIDLKLLKLIRETQELWYGKQGEAEVSYTTIPNKAVLVVGSNIRELDIILEALKDEDIDVYTHDEMMLAHTFPKFSEYRRLKGQFGQGLENCLLDFATFPGPIILTKNSLHNIESFYRGNLFTTDYISSPKGIIKIENNDFSTLIESAENSRGFKRGRNCETITIGFDYEQIVLELQSKLKSNSYKHIFIISLDSYSIEKKAYFEKLIKLTPEDTLIISFSHNCLKENVFHINTCFDNYSWIKIFEALHSFNIPMTIFVPECERSSISQIIYLSCFSNTEIFVGKCIPILLNPALMNTLQSHFSIKNITNAKKDIEEIFKDK